MITANVPLRTILVNLNQRAGLPRERTWPLGSRWRHNYPRMTGSARACPYNEHALIMRAAKTGNPSPAFGAGGLGNAGFGLVDGTNSAAIHG